MRLQRLAGLGVITSAMLVLLAIPLGLLGYAIGGALAGPLVLMSLLVALQAPGFLLVKWLKWLPKVERDVDSPSHSPEGLAERQE